MGKHIPVAPGERPWDERIEELYAFLTAGKMPEGVTIGRWRKLSPSAAMSLIWFLQEQTEVLPDRFEQCWSCKEMFDSDREGHYDNKKLRHYCDNCEHLDKS